MILTAGNNVLGPQYAKDWMLRQHGAARWHDWPEHFFPQPGWRWVCCIDEPTVCRAFILTNYYEWQLARTQGGRLYLVPETAFYQEST